MVTPATIKSLMMYSVGIVSYPAFCGVDVAWKICTVQFVVRSSLEKRGTNTIRR